MHLFYSRTAGLLPDGAIFRNVRFFAGAEEGASLVTVEGDHPEVADAYEAAGVPVERIGVAEPAPQRDAPPFAPNPDAGSVEIPDDWRDLSWQPLRKLAAQIAPVVLNKADATAAIEGEIKRRAATPEPRTPVEFDEAMVEADASESAENAE